MAKRHKCDCYLHEHQVCDICQGVTGDERDVIATITITGDEVRKARRQGIKRTTERFYAKKLKGMRAGLRRLLSDSPRQQKAKE